MQIKLVKDEVRPAVRRITEKCANPAAIMQGIGEAVVAIGRRAFFEPALRPAPWAARKTNQAWPILLKNKLLVRSLRVTEHSATSVTVGSDRPYAAIHQLGGPIGRRVPKAQSAGAEHAQRKQGKPGMMPARPYFPVTADGRLTPAAQAAIADVVQAYIGKDQA